MHIWRNHLVAGCVDKAAFGKHGLLHIFYELYGAERTSIFTAALSRLFTAYLQVCVPVWGGGGGARLVCALCRGARGVGAYVPTQTGPHAPPPPPAPQLNGFTCGMADVALVSRAEAQRADLLTTADVRCLDAAATFVGLPSPLELVAGGEAPVRACGGGGGGGGGLGVDAGAGAVCCVRETTW